MGFQVWNFPKFHTWNRIFFWFCKESCECCKFNENYLLWTLSEPIFSKIRGPSFLQENPLYFFSNLKSKTGFFCNFPKKIANSKISQIYLLWILSEPIFSKIREPFSGGREGGSFKVESDFSPLFLRKIRKLENCAHLFCLKFIWANFEQDQSTFF